MTSSSYEKRSLADNISHDFEAAYTSGEEDGDQLSEEDRHPQVSRGSLNKWTNLLHGWQERYFQLSEGVFSYYKSEDEIDIGCRGSLKLRNVCVRPHEYDECRFEVRVGDSIWYLRGANITVRNSWIQLLDLHRICSESGYDSSDQNLKRQNSLLSINSAASMSIASGSSFRRGHRLKQKLAEMDTFKEILCRQVDSLQCYFDVCSTIARHAAHDLEHDLEDHDFDEQDGASTSSAMGSSGGESEINSTDGHIPNEDLTTVLEEDSAVTPSVAPQQTRGSFFSRFLPFKSSVGINTDPDTSSSEKVPAVEAYEPTSRFLDLKRILEQHGAHALDFKGESYTFKATTTGILTNLSHCIDLMQQREDQWRKRVEREQERRRRSEEAYRNLSDIHKTPAKMIVLGGPDYEEGPNCTIADEEFYDAVDAQLDRMAVVEDGIEAIKNVGSSLKTMDHISPSHPLYANVNQCVEDRLKLCDPSAERLSLEEGWNLIAEDGEMTMYSREMETADGIVLDPLQAMHTVEGVTARELCNYFWNLEYRMAWEITIDEPPTVLEVCGDDTVVIHQVYKRIWPASQRDALFWSHIRKIEDRSQCNPAAADMWLVMNCSTPFPDACDVKLPRSVEDMVRLTLDVILICQTFVEGGGPLTDQTPRDKIRSKLLYAASVNPGGWAPATVLRTISKREFPRFLKRFSQYVIDETSSKPLFV